MAIEQIRAGLLRQRLVTRRLYHRWLDVGGHDRLRRPPHVLEPAHLGSAPFSDLLGQRRLAVWPPRHPHRAGSGPSCRRNRPTDLAGTAVLASSRPGGAGTAATGSTKSPTRMKRNPDSLTDGTTGARLVHGVGGAGGGPLAESCCRPAAGQAGLGATATASRMSSAPLKRRSASTPETRRNGSTRPASRPVYGTRQRGRSKANKPVRFKVSDIRVVGWMALALSGRGYVASPGTLRVTGCWRSSRRPRPFAPRLPSLAAGERDRAVEAGGGNAVRGAPYIQHARPGCPRYYSGLGML